MAEKKQRSLFWIISTIYLTVGFSGSILAAIFVFAGAMVVSGTPQPVYLSVLFLLRLAGFLLGLRIGVNYACDRAFVKKEDILKISIIVATIPIIFSIPFFLTRGFALADITTLIHLIAIFYAAKYFLAKRTMDAGSVNQIPIASPNFKKVLIFIALATCAVFGFFTWQYSIAPKEETADWKTYRNEQYGFEIKYPPKAKEISLTYSDIPLFSYYFPEGNEPVVYNSLIIKADNNPSGLSVNNWISKNETCGIDPKSYENINIAGEVGIKLQGSGACPPGGGGIAYKVYIPRDSKIFSIAIGKEVLSSETEESKREQKDTFDKVLSTFKFIPAGSGSETNLAPGTAQPVFEDFPIAEKFSGQPASPNFSSNPDAQRFITVVTNGAKIGPNFAGHYTVVTWGCGTGCNSGVIIDAKSGNIYPMGAFACSYDFRLDSYLLIGNPCLGTFTDYPPLYYKWENNQLVAI